MTKRIPVKNISLFFVLALLICMTAIPTMAGTVYESYDNDKTKENEGIYQNENIKSDEVTDNNSNPASLRSKIFFQGRFGFSLGSTKSIEITPIVGVHLTDKMNVGAGVTYEYLCHDDFDSHIYGGEIFTEYDLFQGFYAKADYRYRVYKDYYQSVKYSSKSVPYLFLGGGYRPRISRNVAFQIEILYDVIQDDFSQYNDNEPIISVGVIVGF